MKNKPPMSPGRFAKFRALARELFPAWSRHARARWVVAKMKTAQPRVPISASWCHDARAYRFDRIWRA
jgi:hypothetical protein